MDSPTVMYLSFSLPLFFCLVVVLLNIFCFGLLSLDYEGLFFDCYCFTFLFRLFIVKL